MNTDIPVKYINKTKSVDFETVVFTKNYSTNTPKTYYVAWQILRGQSSVSFVFPEEVSVGASYTADGQQITAGPFKASLGSTWEITQEMKTDTAVLTQKTGIPKNPNNSIVVKNIPPNAWSGRKFDIGVYKSHRLLAIQKEVRVGDQVDFMLQPKLYFGVVSNLKIGDVFTSLQITSSLTEFDLSNYPNGIEVTLTEAPGGGLYTFSGEQMT